MIRTSRLTTIAVHGLLAAAVMAGFLTAASPASASPQGRAQRADVVTMQNQLIELTNQQRARHGCGQLRIAGRLGWAAQAHSREMAATGNFSHTSRDGSSFVARARRQGFRDAGAENIAYGYRSASETMRGWMNSPGHRANILNCALKSVGTGVAYSAGGTPYYTQDFGWR